MLDIFIEASWYLIFICTKSISSTVQLDLLWTEQCQKYNQLTDRICCLIIWRTSYTPIATDIDTCVSISEMLDIYISCVLCNQHKHYFAFSPRKMDCALSERAFIFVLHCYSEWVTSSPLPEQKNLFIHFPIKQVNLPHCCVCNHTQFSQQSISD